MAVAQVVTPEVARAIAELPVLGLVIFAFLVVVVGLWRKWWVPGWLFMDERTARITAETQAVRNAEALEAINTAFVAYVKEGAALRREVRALRDELRGRRA